MSIEQYWENILTIIFDNEQVNKESAFALFCEAFPTLGKEHKKYHRFYPAVYEGVKEWADSDIQVVKVLSQRYKQSFRYNNQVLMEAYQAQDALRKMNIESLLFKGSAWIAMNSRNLYRRKTSDLDLIIRYKDLKQAVKVLEPLFDYKEFSNHSVGFKKDGRVSLDLHFISSDWQLTKENQKQKIVLEDRLFKEQQEVFVNKTKFTIPKAEDLVFHNLLNYFAHDHCHSNLNRRWGLDLHFLLEDQNLDIKEICELIKQYHALPLFIAHIYASKPWFSKTVEAFIAPILDIKMTEKEIQFCESIQGFYPADGSTWEQDEYEWWGCLRNEGKPKRPWTKPFLKTRWFKEHHKRIIQNDLYQIKKDPNYLFSYAKRLSRAFGGFKK